MKLEKDLIHFGYKNKNGRIYEKDSYDWDKLIELSNNGRLLGTFGDIKNKNELNFSEISHKINNIQIYEDGVFGEIEILKTQQGILLENLINNNFGISLSCRSFGSVDNNGVVHVEKIISFDAIIGDSDIHIYRRKKLEKIIKKINDKR